MTPFEEQLILAIVEQLQILQRPSPTMPISDSEIFDAYRFLMTILSTVTINIYIISHHDDIK